MITLSWGKANDVKGWRKPDVKEYSKVKIFDNIKEQQDFIVCCYYVKISLSRFLTVDQADLRDVTLAWGNLGGNQRNRLFAKVQSAYLSGFTLNFFRGRGEC